MKVTSVHERHAYTIRSGVEAFFRHRKLFFCICLGVFVAVTAATLLQKRQYKSDMELLLENSRSSAVITSDRSSSPALPELSEQQVNSELAILESDDLLSLVADPGWSTTLKTNPSLVAETMHEHRINDLRKGLTVALIPKSNVIAVSFTASSPTEAMDVLKRFEAAYLAQRRELSRPTGTSNFFAEEADRYQQLWQEANGELAIFQQRHHLVSVQQAEDSLSKQIVGYADDLRTSRASLTEMDSRVAASGMATAKVPQRQATQQHTTFNQNSVDQLRSLLVQLQNRRTELSTRYTQENRLVKEVDTQIAQTKDSLRDAIAQQGHEETTDVNPAWQQAQNTLIQGSIERKALQAKTGATAQTLANLQHQLVELQSLDVAFNTLEERVDQARGNFELFAQKRDQAQIEDAMDQHKLVNIAVAESPTFGSRPVSPKPVLNGALGFLTALFVAGAAVYVASSSRNTVGSARELEGASIYPVLATISMLSAASVLKTEPRGEDGVAHRRDGSPLTSLSSVTENFRRVSDL